MRLIVFVLEAIVCAGVLFPCLERAKGGEEVGARPVISLMGGVRVTSQKQERISPRRRNLGIFSPRLPPQKISNTKTEPARILFVGEDNGVVASAVVSDFNPFSQLTTVLKRTWNKATAAPKIAEAAAGKAVFDCKFTDKIAVVPVVYAESA